MMSRGRRQTSIDDLPSHCLQDILARVGNAPLPFCDLLDGGHGASHPLQCAPVSRHFRLNSYSAVRSLTFHTTRVEETHMRGFSRFEALTRLTFHNCGIVPLHTTEQCIISLAGSTPKLETLELDPWDDSTDEYPFARETTEIEREATTTVATTSTTTLTTAFALAIPLWKHLRQLDMGLLLREGDRSGASLLFENLAERREIETTPRSLLERLSFIHSPEFFDPPLPLAEICAIPAMRRLLSSLRELHMWSPELPPPSMSPSPVLRTLHLVHDWDGGDRRLLLSGTLPALAQLTSLSLVGWEISELPESLGSLSKLKHLTFNDCSRLRSLPSSLAELRDLESLELRACRDLQGLPEGLGGLASLQRLHISTCHSLTALPSRLEDGMRSLTCLTVINCSGLSKLVPLGGMRRLKMIRIYLCPLRSLPASVGKLADLEVLSIYHCEWERMPQTIGHLRSLLKLDVSYCASLTSLPNEVSNLASLRELHLTNCKALRRLPRDIGRLQSLRELDVSGCEALRALPVSLVQITGLEKLFLLRISPEKILPRGLGAFQRLRKLSLEASNAGGPWVPESLSQLSSLEDLSIGFNFLERSNPGLMPGGGEGEHLGNPSPPPGYLRHMQSLKKLELVTSAGALSVDVSQLPALENLVWKASWNAQAASSAIVDALRSMGLSVVCEES